MDYPAATNFSLCAHMECKVRYIWLCLNLDCFGCEFFSHGVLQHAWGFIWNDTFTRCLIRMPSWGAIILLSFEDFHADPNRWFGLSLLVSLRNFSASYWWEGSRCTPFSTLCWSCCKWCTYIGGLLIWRMIIRQIRDCGKVWALVISSLLVLMNISKALGLVALSCLQKVLNAMLTKLFLLDLHWQRMCIKQPERMHHSHWTLVRNTFM